MANNGINGTMRVFGWISGAVIFLILIYTTFHQPLVKAIAEEAIIRQINDSIIIKEVAEKLVKIADQNKDMEVILARLETNMEYVKKVIK